MATAHRAENVDDIERLSLIILGLNQVAMITPVVFSCHPRTRERINKFGMTLHKNIKVIEPVGFFDFVNLEQNSIMAISDSGTVQEEMCIFGIPTITIRDTTERPETVWCGSNVIVGASMDKIVEQFEMLLERKLDWQPPTEYIKKNVSDTVVNILLSV